MIDAGTIFAIAFAIFLMAFVAAAYALLRTADDRAGDGADWLGVGGDNFPHDGAQ